MTNESDREVERGLRENVYWQVFCGLDHFVTGKQLNASSLSKIRKVLGPRLCVNASQSRNAAGGVIGTGK